VVGAGYDSVKRCFLLRCSTDHQNPEVRMKEFVCANDYYPLLPNGTYIAQCVGFDINESYGGRSRKIYLHFKIIEGSHQKSKLFMAFNYPKNCKFTPGRKYWQYWVLVHGRIPSRNAAMSPRIFKNKVFKIKTRTVNRKFPNGKEMPSDFNYSTVDTIEEVMA
jgi:hypothetical protein